MLNLTQISIGYRKILKREPDPVGIEYWLAREDVTYNKFCLDLLDSTELWKNSLVWPYRQYWYLPNFSLVYVPIAKNANTSFKKSLALMDDFFNLEIFLSDIHNMTDHFCTGLQLSDYPINVAEDIINKVRRKDLFAFAIIRDPYERLVSVYLEKFVYGRWEGNNPITTTETMQKVQKTSKVDLYTGISFADFIECITNENLNEANEHWKPQYLYLNNLPFSLYNFKHLDSLREKLGNISGNKFVEYRENVVASTGKLFVPDAYQFLASDFEKYPMISIDSLYSPDLVSKVYDCYNKYLELYRACY